MTDPSLAKRIAELLSSQLQGVLATQHRERPYTSLLAFAHTPDLRYLVFATYRDTQKHANLMHNAAVSFLIDNRCNAAIDFEHAMAVSVSGRAEVIPDADHSTFVELYAGKQLTLRDFVSSSTCALLRVDVSCIV